MSKHLKQLVLVFFLREVKASKEERFSNIRITKDWREWELRAHLLLQASFERVFDKFNGADHDVLHKCFQSVVEVLIYTSA
jgi:hypothetical protein